MSLIHICQLCEANASDYLTELQRHAKEVAANPGRWMPWNCRETLARAVPVLPFVGTLTVKMVIDAAEASSPDLVR
jgi:hypothetical protein